MLNFDKNIRIVTGKDITNIEYTYFEDYLTIKTNLIPFAGAAITALYNKSVICIGPKLIELPVRCQKAILFHEIGHIINGHTEQTFDKSLTDEERKAKRIKYKEERRSFVKNGSVDPREFIADAYAANRIGAEIMIESLLYVIDINQRIIEKIISHKSLTDQKRQEILEVCEVSKKEVKLRIEELKKINNKKITVGA